MYLLRNDLYLHRLVQYVAVLLVALVGLVFVFLIVEAVPALSSQSFQKFVQFDGWFPLEGKLGFGPMVIASLVVGLGALVLAAIVGVLLAVWLKFFAPQKLSHAYRSMLVLLSGIPSVVFGLWGMLVLVPLIAQIQAPGASALAGILVLFLMVLPTVALGSHAALQSLPNEYLFAARALGMSRFAIVFFVAIPAVRNGLVVSVILAGLRALGETMAVLMVAGNVVQVPTSLFDPVRVLTANIALEIAYATGDHRAVLFVSGILLMLLVLVLTLLADRFTVVQHAKS